MSEEIEVYVLANASFREVSDEMFRTKITRGSIDRLEITLILKTILREQLGGFDLLYFLTEEAISKKKTIRASALGDSLKESVTE